jgi:acyl-homoserine lactone acylase PvdQ
VALNVLPPGQSGSLAFGRNASDQIALYDGLTPLGANVTAQSLRRYFKSARFGLEGQRPARTDRPRAGVRIQWDRWGVPHVFGTKRADVHFGAGWVTAQNRGLLLQLLRWAGRIAALDVPGVNPFAVALSGRRFTPSPEAEAILRQQERVVSRHSPQARQLLRDVDAFVAGINAYNASVGIRGERWGRVDVIAVVALMGANLGLGGGDETRRSLFLDALERQLGTERARQVWQDLRGKQDPETPLSIGRRFAYGGGSTIEAGSAVLDDGSFTPTGAAGPQSAMSAWPAQASNALLVSRGRSTNGHPVLVAGPQVGHAYPQLLMELDLHGGGIHARGASFPGLSFYVLLGRGSDYAWSVTSSNSDVVDHFVEELCSDDTHYRFRGTCREMGTVDAGTLQQGPGQPDRRLTYRTTVHGPVLGYATIDGRRVAVSSQRSTRGRELLSALMFQDLNTGAVRNARTFLRAAAKLEFTFNILYADDRDIAMFSTGRLPLRARSADGSLPTIGNGDYEWRGVLSAEEHPQIVNPPGGTILQWNNKPAADFAASDDNWSFGSVHRVELLRAGMAGRRKHSPATLVGVMNGAATQDLRVLHVWPVIAEVLRGSQAPSVRAQAMVDALTAWQRAGGSRIDRDLDGRIDHSGAVIMDAAWRGLADAVMAPVLGPLTARLGALQTWSDNASGDGSSFGSGWYGWIDKDLRRLLGRRGVKGPYTTRFCGGGVIAACRSSLWAALEAAGAELAAIQGPDPERWRADATRERINYSPLPRTMRFANRPTFQQVMSFKGHRPRR